MFTMTLPAIAGADEDIPGTASRSYQSAVQLWLDGSDNLEALRQLSSLANKGNTAAQILLARIGSHAHLIGPVTENLPRNERVALLRQPGGLSGRSWLEAAAEISPLAHAMLDSADRETRADAIAPLFKAGEFALATRAFAALFNSGQGNLAVEIVNSSVILPPEAAFFLARMVRGGQVGAAAYSGSALIPRSADGFPTPLAMTWAPVAPRDLLEDPGQRGAAIEYSMHVPAFLPLVDLCRERCPNEVAECSAAGAAELWSADVMPFASPSQALIPDNIYWVSGRIQQDVLQRLSHGGGRTDWSYYEPISACFASMMRGREE
ncbi:hypothetical protein [Aliiroseovarius crassostreae]|nr:hypothetical protein [Aliiroseovarius crassostreae]